MLLFLLSLVTESIQLLNISMSDVANVRWKKLIFRVSVWLTLELFFDRVGLDTIADYSEFVFERNFTTLVS